MTPVRSRAAQAIHEFIQRTPYQGIARRGALKVAHLARKILVAAGDPIIETTIGGQRMKVPLSHKFPLDRKNFPAYSDNTPRIAVAVKAKYPDMTFIDIGANVGDTVALLREYEYFPILAIEGEPRFQELLQQNLRGWPEVSMALTYVGAAPARIRALPVTRAGTSWLEQRGPNEIEIRTLPEVLKDFAPFISARMVKIDTDGFEGQILRGAKQWLNDHRPILFVEYAPKFWRAQGEDPEAVVQFLASLGYTRALVYEEMGAYEGVLDTADASEIHALTAHFSSEKDRPYCDLCFFSDSDRDLADQLHESEIAQRGAPPAHAWRTSA